MKTLAMKGKWPGTLTRADFLILNLKKMKKLESLGKKLSKSDQKNVMGGAKPYWTCLNLGEFCDVTVWQHPCCDGYYCETNGGQQGWCQYIIVIGPE
jgi:hypothetical protein